MPVKRTVSKRSRRLDDYRRQQLLDGPDASLLAGVGYLRAAASFDQMSADDQAQAMADMARDWAVHGAELMAWWRLGKDAPTDGVKPWAFVSAGGPDTLPWAAEQFGLPDDLD